MTASQPAYAAGQLWRCAGRTPDENPTVLINQVDRHPLGGEIYHVTLDGLRLKNPRAPGGVVTRLPHIPIIAQGLDASQAVFAGEQAPDPAYREGYAQWKAAFDAQQMTGTEAGSQPSAEPPLPSRFSPENMSFTGLFKTEPEGADQDRQGGSAFFTQLYSQ